MTTHDQHADVYATEGQIPASQDQPQYAPAQDQNAPRDTGVVPEDRGASRQPDVDVREGQTPVAADQTHATQQASGTRETSTEGMLFADDELVGMRARWDSVQAGFVDDPRDCVQKADGLVSDLVDQLTSGFAQARSRLEEQWARGEQASTEDLRVALKRYRSFFERLLSV
ncbi:conserved hypothetical protein [uncultured Mycobacterium sp.]|uniref:Uncharacterized protein n=1 Tax=uncultured Mycobacterium sp. TaxID=171292 RepID=A0A1Y5PDN3_9MYCO|nr:conserved hypothetical protein [uncultured Mycobacterium sp.]